MITGLNSREVSILRGREPWGLQLDMGRGSGNILPGPRSWGEEVEGFGKQEQRRPMYRPAFALHVDSLPPPCPHGYTIL